jgi:predicted DNA-binding transcriptional regulator AlpA
MPSILSPKLAFVFFSFGERVGFQRSAHSNSAFSERGSRHIGKGACHRRASLARSGAERQPNTLDIARSICKTSYGMVKRSSEQVAKLIGISNASLSRYIKAGKVPAPPETMAGGMRMRLWSESDIEHLKGTLPKIANGRKTRYKKHSEVSSQQSAKTKAQPRKAVPRKKQPKKK